MIESRDEYLAAFDRLTAAETSSHYAALAKFFTEAYLRVLAPSAADLVSSKVDFQSIGLGEPATDVDLLTQELVRLLGELDEDDPPSMNASRVAAFNALNALDRSMTPPGSDQAGHLFWSLFDPLLYQGADDPDFFGADEDDDKRVAVVRRFFSELVSPRSRSAFIKLADEYAESLRALNKPPD